MKERVAPVHLLVVDDHRKIREPLAVWLRRQGYTVLTAENADTLWLMLRARPFDLIVLDVMWPDGDGMVLCQQIQRRSKTPVILLTARDTVADRIAGLDYGADDYVVKPFEPRELLARIQSVLRRAGQNTLAAPSALPVRNYAFSGLSFDPASRRLTHHTGEERLLSTMEGKFLTAFLDHPHTVLSREILIDKCITPGNEVFDRAIDRQVSRLRTKLLQLLPDKMLLITVWGEGYSLVSEVKVA